METIIGILFLMMQGVFPAAKTYKGLEAGQVGHLRKPLSPVGACGEYIREQGKGDFAMVTLTFVIDEMPNPGQTFTLDNKLVVARRDDSLADNEPPKIRVLQMIDMRRPWISITMNPRQAQQAKCIPKEK